MKVLSKACLEVLHAASEIQAGGLYIPRMQLQSLKSEFLLVFRHLEVISL